MARLQHWFEIAARKQEFISKNENDSSAIVITLDTADGLVPQQTVLAVTINPIETLR